MSQEQKVPRGNQSFLSFKKGSHNSFFVLFCFRCFVGSNGGPAQWPDCNRYVEAIISKRCEKHPVRVRSKGSSVQRWSLVIKSYNQIRDSHKQRKGDGTDKASAGGDQSDNVDSVVIYDECRI